MLSRTSVSIAAAGAGLCFLGYCVYFDKKRRSDPDFKKKLREKRNTTKKVPGAGSGGGGSIQLPDMSDPTEVQKFFFTEMQVGEELLNAGELESGIEHLGNAIVVSGQTQQLLGILQQTLTPQVFAVLVQSLPAAAQRLSSSLASSQQSTKSGPKITELEEDDVE